MAGSVVGGNTGAVVAPGAVMGATVGSTGGASVGAGAEVAVGSGVDVGILTLISSIVFPPQATASETIATSRIPRASNLDGVICGIAAPRA